MKLQHTNALLRRLLPAILCGLIGGGAGLFAALSTLSVFAVEGEAPP